MRNDNSPTNTAVIGLQFGDEGKGQVVDRLTADHDVVVRFNGGANAGHSVWIGDERFALHQLPSGILSPGKLCHIAYGCVVEPDGLLAEIDGLRGRGVEVGDNLTISARAHVVLPRHVEEDRRRGGALGTTGRGIGPCYADKAYRDEAVRVGDLFEHGVDEMYAQWASALEPFVTEEEWPDDRRVLFEGAHAVLLDVDYGTYPFVTSSSCTGRVMPADRRIGVAKAYMSRVGEGPFPTEITGRAAERLRALGEEYGTTTGRPRRVGWLDLVALRHAVRAAMITEIALTGIAVLQDLGTFKVASAYRLDGELTTRFPAHAAALGRAEPVVDDVADAERFIELIEAQIAPVRFVAAGRSREELVERAIG
ncbi:MAG: adenylosuccinate synthetase [Vicinamibacterales bacterium]